MTLFDRLKIYYESNPEAPHLTHIQKTNLGRMVVSKWYATRGHKLTLVKSVEDTGTYTVMSYPDNFASDVDKIIGDFYASVETKKRHRKRIVKPRYSAKPNGKTN